MRLKDWLSAGPGRAARLSKYLGFDNGSMVSQMAHGIVNVPVKHYRAIRDFTGGEVTLDDLLPCHDSPREKAMSRDTRASRSLT